MRHATNGRSHAAVSAVQAMSTMSLFAAIVSRAAHTNWGTFKSKVAQMRTHLSEAVLVQAGASDTLA